jgi:hypothetical protein
VTHIIVPPPADPRELIPESRDFARPLYEVVNQVPGTADFPASISITEQESYRCLLEEVLERTVDQLEEVSSKRIHGLIGRTDAWLEFQLRATNGEREDGDILEVIANLSDRTDEHTDGGDRDLAMIPEDLLLRSRYYYSDLLRRQVIPPIYPAYGQLMCQVLAKGMAAPYRLTTEIFPFLVRNPPLGFTPKNIEVYRILVA